MVDNFVSFLGALSPSFSLFWAITSGAQGLYLACALGSLPALLREPFTASGIELESTACETSVLLSYIISLVP